MPWTIVNRGGSTFRFDTNFTIFLRAGPAFAIALLRPARLQLRTTDARTGDKMSITSLIVAIIAVVVTVYLFYALIRPEKF